jgi:hypothetical protein
MTDTSLHDLFAFIPVLESGALREAHSVYITTGEYPPPVRDLYQCLQKCGLASDQLDWMAWVDQARPFLQSPEKILAADAETVDKLRSLATFSERLNKSFFPHLCSSGFMLMLLKRMQTTHCN